jgi:hypothetical protein
MQADESEARNTQEEAGSPWTWQATLDKNSTPALTDNGLSPPQSYKTQKIGKNRENQTETDRKEQKRTKKTQLRLAYKSFF